MDWCTPQDFFDRLNEEFGFVLDAAATIGLEGIEPSARQTRSNTCGVGSARTVKRIYKRLFGTLTGSLIERENRPRKERGFSI
jgi:hypothetical protein